MLPSLERSLGDMKGGRSAANVPAKTLPPSRWLPILRRRARAQACEGWRSARRTRCARRRADAYALRGAFGEAQADQILAAARASLDLCCNDISFPHLAEDITVEARLALALTAEINELDDWRPGRAPRSSCRSAACFTPAGWQWTPRGKSTSPTSPEGC